MIPYAILSGQLQSDTLDKRSGMIRILELSPESFTFRLDNAIPMERIEKVQSVVLHFYSFAGNTYKELTLQEFQVAVVEQQPFWNLYQITTKDVQFRGCALDLSREYTRYIRLKLEEEDATVSSKMVGYPEEVEQWKDTKQGAGIANGNGIRNENGIGNKTGIENRDGIKRLCDKKEEGQVQEPDTDWNRETYQLAIGLDNRQLQEAYLRYPLEEFQKRYWQEHGLTGHPLAKQPVTHCYIGNQFCPLLFPEETVLFSLLEKMAQEQVEPVLVFSYMEESSIPQVRQILEGVADWCLGKWEEKKRSGRKCDRIELLLNDWGMMALVQEVGRKKGVDCFSSSLGVLLNKRRKDTRLLYKNGASQYIKRLWENSCNEKNYATWLREHWGIERIEYESCGYPVRVQEELDGSLHIPYYQMNTSNRCTLYAACRYGARGHQNVIKSCPGYCSRQEFQYPEGLHLKGRYNSIFGYEETSLLMGERVQEMLKQKIDRIVVTL